jgi:hypothetical protein
VCVCVCVCVCGVVVLQYRLFGGDDQRFSDAMQFKLKNKLREEKWQ